MRGVWCVCGVVLGCACLPFLLSRSLSRALALSRRWWLLTFFAILSLCVSCMYRYVYWYLYRSLIIYLIVMYIVLLSPLLSPLLSISMPIKNGI